MRRTSFRDDLTRSLPTTPSTEKAFGGGCTMRFGERNIRVRSLIEIGVGLFACLVTPPAFCSAMQNTVDAPQQGKAPTGHGPLTTEQVVEKLVGMNLRRASRTEPQHLLNSARWTRRI